jgi:hypothetical protein
MVMVPPGSLTILKVIMVLEIFSSITFVPPSFTVTFEAMDATGVTDCAEGASDLTGAGLEVGAVGFAEVGFAGAGFEVLTTGLGPGFEAIFAALFAVLFPLLLPVLLAVFFGAAVTRFLALVALLLSSPA